MAKTNKQLQAEILKTHLSSGWAKNVRVKIKPL